MEEQKKREQDEADTLTKDEPEVVEVIENEEIEDFYEDVTDNINTDRDHGTGMLKQIR